LPKKLAIFQKKSYWYQYFQMIFLLSPEILVKPFWSELEHPTPSTGIFCNSGSGNIYSVDRLINHPQYHDIDGKPRNDICLIHLTEPIPLNNQVNIVCLPDSHDINSTSECYAGGFGNTKYVGNQAIV